MGALRTTWTAQLHPTSNLQNCLGVTGDRWEPLCDREAEGMGNCTVNLAHSSAYFTHSVFSVRKNHKHPPDFSETASCGVRWSPHFTGVCPPVWPSPSPFLPSYAQLLHLFTLPCLVAVTLEFHGFGYQEFWHLPSPLEGLQNSFGSGSVSVRIFFFNFKNSQITTA